MEAQIKSPTLTFNLRSKSSETTLIYYIIRFEGKIIVRKSCEVKVKPSQWSRRRNRCIISSEYSPLDNHNNKIANLKLKEIEKAFEDFIYNFEDLSNLEKALSETFMGRKKKEVSEVTIASMLDLFKKKPITEATKKSYVFVMKDIEAYIISSNTPRTWKEVATRKFLLGFREYLIKEKSLSVSSVNVSILRASAIFKNLIDKGVLTNSQYLDLKIEPLKNLVKSDNQPFLYENEVLALLRLDLEKEADIRTRDLFCLSCLTGQRYSDMSKLGLSKIGGVYFYDIITDKSSTVVRCKVYFQAALDLLEKYKDCGIKIPSKVNEKIKEIARRAGLNRTWNNVSHEAGSAKPKVEQKKLWEVIHFHTGRHTFDSILKIRGLSYQQISEMTGHDENQVKEYTKSVKSLDYTITQSLKRYERLLLVGEVRTALKENEIYIDLSNMKPIRK